MRTSKTVLCDCLDYMRSLQDNTYDLLVADPPYFSGPNRRGFYGKKSNTVGPRVLYPKTDNWDIPTGEYFREMFRISKNQIIWGVNYFTDNWHFGPGRIVWDKVNGASSFSDCEIAYCSMHDSVRLFRFMWNGMCQGKSVSDGATMQGNKKLNEVRIHPTQKPVALYQWIFQTYAKPGWSIFDPYLGSQSSRIAAYDLGMGFVGVEKEKIHFDRGERRFEDYLSQENLFLMKEATHDRRIGT